MVIDIEFETRTEVTSGGRKEIRDKKGKSELKYLKDSSVGKLRCVSGVHCIETWCMCINIYTMINNLHQAFN